MDEILEMRWYVVGAPWLPSDAMPYIVAGNEDPHVGVPVVDVMDLDDWDPDHNFKDERFAIASHIVDMHNRWLDDRDARRPR